jgi:hypothetical protein
MKHHLFRPIEESPLEESFCPFSAVVDRLRHDIG